MRSLYAGSEPFAAAQLDVGSGHSIYVEQCGREDGLPVVFLHGGPGSGCKPDHRQFFDPARYRVFLFDQRGAGRSRPAGAVENNTTQALIEDLEFIRSHNGIERWSLFGGSWGATLALAYAEQHPERVAGLVLRGTFLARRTDLRWFCGGGANLLLPCAWNRFLDSMELKDTDDVVHAVHRDVFSAEESRVQRAARAWDAWSGAVVSYSLERGPESGFSELASAIAKTRIEMHFALNGYFLRENQLLADIHRVPKVPTYIVHGQRDITCLPDAAWSLHRALPHSRVEFLHTAGHLSGETPMIDALVRAADDLAAALA